MPFVVAKLLCALALTAGAVFASPQETPRSVDSDELTFGTPGRGSSRDVVVNCQPTSCSQGSTGPDCSAIDARLAKIEAALVTLNNTLKGCTAPQPVIPQPVACPYDYTTVGPVCFKIYTTTRSWYDAKAACEGLGSNAGLLVVEDEDTWEAVRDEISRQHPNNEIWFGLKKAGSTWKWTNGNIATYDDWESSQPNGDGDCARVNCYSSSCDRRWWDGPCSETDYYACQYY